MAREHEVVVLTVQPEEDFCGNKNPLFPENVKVISLYRARQYHTVFNILPGKFADAINYRLLKKTFAGKTNRYFLKAYPLLIKALKEVKPHLVYYENLEAVGFFSQIVKRNLPGVKQIYDAHNVDSELWNQLAHAQKNPEFENYAAKSLQTEKNLYRMVNSFLCCSEIDRKKLLALNGAKKEGWTIPNGVDTTEKLFDDNPLKHSRKEILFCGSMDYYPNEEGMLWFYNNVFPLVRNEIPGVALTLVGTTQIKENYKSLMNDLSVNFEGRVEDVKPYYYRASVCIAPLLSGSGTRLKILEAMSFGNPVVSTRIGAEGIDAINGKELLIADDAQEFAQAIIDLLKNNELFGSIRKAALSLVKEKYDWKKIGSLINAIIA
jgi:glycosyltransferase involved in cell wall biosynthesis